MKTNEKASPFSENGRGSNNNVIECEDTENNNLIKAVSNEFTELNPKASKFPIEIFPPFYRKLLIELNTKLGYHIDYLAASLFFTLATAVGNRIKLKHKESWYESPIFYQAIVGKPGDGKTPALNFMQKPLQEIEDELYEENEERLKEYQCEIESGNTCSRPELKQYLVSDATSEAVLKIHSINKKGVGIAVDEFRSFTNSFNKYSNGNDEEFYLSAFSGSPVKKVRVTKGTIRIADPNINVLGSIQPKMIGATFNGKKLVNGFMDRVLFYWPENFDGIEWNTNEIDNYFIQEYTERIKSIYRFSEEQEDPFIIRIEPEILKFFHNWRNTGKEDTPEEERGVMAKYQQYILRFFILLHLLWYFSEDELPGVINYETVVRGIKLYDYFRENGKRAQEQINSTYYDGLTETKKKLFDLLPKHFKTGDGAKISLDNGLLKERSFKTFIKDKRLFKKVDYGMYEKLII